MKYLLISCLTVILCSYAVFSQPPPPPPLGVFDFIELETDLTVLPNPMTDKSIIVFSNPNDKNHSLSVFNIEGKIVYSKQNIITNSILLDRNDFVAGVYFIVISWSNNKLSTKLIVQ